MAITDALPRDIDQQCPSSFVVTRYPIPGTRYPFTNREA
jgi:hypothetical protein